MEKNEIISILKEQKVLQEGHFILSSGRHADTYIQCARVLQQPEITTVFIQELLRAIQENVDLVVGPATGGIILAYEAARQLGVQGFFTERENGRMVLRRGFQIPKGAKVLVVEDVVTTGGSVKEVLELVESEGGAVVAIGLLVDRSGGRADFGIPTYRFYSKEIPSFHPEDCPLCRKGLPAVQPGSKGFRLDSK